MNAELPTLASPLASTGRRRKVSFGVSVDADEAKAINERIAQIMQQFGVPITRSTYFELLARHDRVQKSIEDIFCRGNLNAKTSAQIS